MKIKLVRFVLISFLAFILALSPALSYANSITTKLPAGFQIPAVGDVAKRIATRSVAVAYAVEQLLGAVDWVLDPANNQIKFKDLTTAQGNIRIIGGPVIFCDLAKGKKLNNIDELIPLSTACWQKSSTGQGGTVLNYEIKKKNIYVHLRSKSGGKYGDIYEFSSITQYEEKSVSLDVVAQQIITNAQNGHQQSVDFLKAVADDVAKQSVSNEAESDTQSTENTPSDQTQDPTDKPNDRPIKTGNPDLDDVFKDAKTPNGDRFNYHYPGTKEELEDALSKIPDAKQTNPDIDVTLTKLPDGRNISTYPKRKSSADNDPRPGWQITKPNSSKLDYKGNTKP